MHAILIATAALVGLPILLHLIMKQEPKRLPFPALRFLQLKRKTNQRKMKLRHFLLLAMRMLLIALFGLALFQPVLPSAGLDFGITLSGEQPVAAVIILDTSPTMGYVSGGQTRLNEARQRALELLDDLPANSKVAILDPAEPGATWEPSIGDARRRLEAIKEPHGAAVPVTTALATAYQLLRNVDKEMEQSEPLPRLVAVFSDRTAACWDATRTEDLKKLAASVPPPAVAHLFVDVGVESPADVAVANLELKPQVVPQGQALVLNATVSAAGPGVEATLKIKFTPQNANAPAVPEQTQVVIVAGDSSQGASFTVNEKHLLPGLYQAELRVETPDNLGFDNVRYLTFKVAEPRKILAIADDPDEAEFWRLAHEVKGEFACEVVKSDAVPDLAKYEAVAILNVTDPSRHWPKLLEYVDAGGKLIIIPGGDANVHRPAYSLSAGEAALRLLPGALKDIFDTDKLDDKRKGGVPWRLDDDALRHPMLAPFRDWKLRGNVDVVVNPRRVWKFWTVEPGPDSGIVARYADNDDAAKCSPAVLEKSVGAKGGKVLLLTTRLDVPKKIEDKWNDYLDTDSSWLVVYPNLLLRHVCGNPADAVLNFATGQAVPLPAPRGGFPMIRIEGPGVTARDAEIPLDAKQAEVRLPPNRTNTAGSFRVFTPDKSWQDGFSLNPPPEESSLVKVPVPAIEDLFGPESVVPVDRKLALRDVLKLKYDQPLELFPWLLIFVLFLLALEAYIANRFYRTK